MLLLTDEGATKQIPSWASDDEEQVTHGATAAVVRVVHQEEGDVTVRVLDDDAGARVDSRSTGFLIFRAAC